ncbi:hypothetical protein ABT369_28285 [Dactylosporangium sp. NPDC000244]|uniref:hypothetical protein n=1 Tax=Dactylosporangium sp. NPDC000244 TaxID=3154365 RepID=UPI00333036D5
MHAFLTGGVVAALLLVEAKVVGSVTSETLLWASAGAALTGLAVHLWRAEGRKVDRLIADALHPNRQADRDDRIIRVANAAQVEL